MTSEVAISAGPTHTQVQTRVFHETTSVLFCGIFAGIRLHDKRPLVRSHQLYPANGWEQRFR